MECNKDEAVKAKELAEKKLVEMDVVGAKTFALKAQNLYPKLDGLPQLLATLDVYVSADKKINGEVDWYRVLAVQPFADEDTIRKHYRKLALVLHPDKNKSVGADGAFKILSEAWSSLSDKGKRIAYDQKRNLRGSIGKSSTSMTTSHDVFSHDFSDGFVSSTGGWKGGAYSKPAAPGSARNSTFWTTCSLCKMHFEYSRLYLNLNLPCINCRKPFFAVETPAPAINGSSKYTSFSEFMQQQKFHKVHSTAQANFSTPSTKRSRKEVFPRSGSNIDASSPASFTTQAAGETLKQGHKESTTDNVREECSRMKCHPSKKTDAGLGTGSSCSASSFGAKKHRPKKRRIDETDMGNHSVIGNEGVGVSSFRKNGLENNAGISRTTSIKRPSQLDVRNILIELAKNEIKKKLRSWKPASLSVSSDKSKAFDEGVVSMKSDAYESVECVDIKSSIRTKRSFTVDSDADPATNQPDPMSMNVPDPDFHDFDQDRTEKSFGESQVWAAYDDDDGMPRYYAMIHGVISLEPFKIRMSWLNSRSNAELAPLNWIVSGFYKTSGDFWIGKYEANTSLNLFSHKVKWSKGRKGAIRIYPRKGDVWALYTNWSSDWNELTPDEAIHKYDMVEVLEDYNEQKGVTVAPLVKMPGFKTVFRKQSEGTKMWTIPREELFRFSHQVPFYMLTGHEGLNAPRGCLELDPAATPSELLQVVSEAQVEEMEVIIERVEEEMEVIIERVEETEPNIRVESVGQGIIKEENENKKPEMIVYGRRQLKTQNGKPRKTF